MSYETFMAVKVYIVIFYVVTPCSEADGYDISAECKINTCEEYLSQFRSLLLSVK